MNLLKLPGPASHIDRMHAADQDYDRFSCSPCLPELSWACCKAGTAWPVRPLRQSYGYSDAYLSLIPAAISVSPVISAIQSMYGTTFPIFPFHFFSNSRFYFLFYPVSVLLSVLCRNAIFHILYLRYPLDWYSSLTPQASAIRAFPWSVRIHIGIL